MLLLLIAMKALARDTHGCAGTSHGMLCHPRHTLQVLPIANSHCWCDARWICCSCPCICWYLPLAPKVLPCLAAHMSRPEGVRTRSGTRGGWVPVIASYLMPSPACCTAACACTHLCSPLLVCAIDGWCLPLAAPMIQLVAQRMQSTTSILSFDLASKATARLVVEQQQPPAAAARLRNCTQRIRRQPTAAV